LSHGLPVRPMPPCRCGRPGTAAPSCARADARPFSRATLPAALARPAPTHAWPVGQRHSPCRRNRSPSCAQHPRVPTHAFRFRPKPAC
jgi:hypothetical protein